MAEGKKSVLLYCDLIHTVKKLDNETAGLLFKHYLSYVNDENPVTDNILVEVVFEPIKQQLKRDLGKWENIKVKRSLAGKASAEKRKQKPTNSTSVKSVQQTSTNSTVTDTVNVTVTDTVTDTVKVNDKVIVSKEKKEADFIKSLQPFIETYGKELLNDFYLYWSETNEGGKKMRFEYAKNQPFNIARRLVTWKKNQKNFKGSQTQTPDDYKQKMLNGANKALEQLKKAGIE